jgi:hypothetical protein
MSLAGLLEEATRDPAECVVELEGEEITELYPQLVEVVVESSRGQADVCTLRFESSRDERGSWQVQDHPAMRPWSKITVEAKFGSRREPVFGGFIKHVRAGYRNGKAAATVEVRAQDESLLLDREAVVKLRSTIEAPRTDKQVVAELASEVSVLTLDAGCVDGLTNETLMQSGTAAAFIRERADANGFEFYVRDGKIHFGPPKLDGEARPPILVQAGRRTNCIDIDVEFDGQQPDAVRVHRTVEGGTEGEALVFEPDLEALGDEPVSSAERGLAPYVLTIRPSGGTEAEIAAAAQAQANALAWKLRAEGELDGALYGHVLRAYELVPVDGVGQTYGGIWYVDAVHHCFTAKGYRQRFKLVRNATGDGALG